MFAGKTAELIMRLEAARDAGRRVAAFKHVLDARYEPQRLVTHDRRVYEAVAVDRVAGLRSGVASSGPLEVIGIDEVHFFGVQHEAVALVELCRSEVAVGREVIAVGLEHDAWGQPFPPIPQLAAVADEVLRLRAPCTVCGAPAAYSQRMVPLGNDQMVGGPAEYEPRCARCFVAIAGDKPLYR